MPLTNKKLAGSHATGRTMQIVRLADLLVARHETAMCRDGVADIETVKRLALNLSWCVDQVQQTLVGDVDHIDWSHRTALDAVRIALHAHPVPWDADRATRTVWKQQIVERATQLATVAVELERGSRTGDTHLRSA